MKFYVNSITKKNVDITFFNFIDQTKQTIKIKLIDIFNVYY